MFTRVPKLIKNIRSITTRHSTTLVVKNRKVPFAVLATSTVFVGAAIYQYQTRSSVDQNLIDYQDKMIYHFADLIIDTIKVNPNITKNELYLMFSTRMIFDEFLTQAFDLAWDDVCHNNQIKYQTNF